MCLGHHRLFYCETFKSLPVQDHIGVKRHNLCENCLLGNHNVDSCFKTSIYSVSGCGKKHTKFLHVESVQGNNRVSTVINNSVNVKSSTVFMPIVPVRADVINKRIITNFISTTKKCRDVNKLWNIEDEGVDSKKITFSQSDKKPSSLWDEKHCVEHEHLMSSIPWKQLDDPFPNNNMIATSRLIPPIMSQEKKNEYSIYDTKVKPFIKNDHLEPVSDISVQSQQKLCFFPHHCISVKTDKIRLLFECASRYQDSSLIDRCHQEPDRSNTIPSICLWFREHPYIIPSDTEAMYKQMLVHLEDKYIFRLLWFNAENLAHHCMNVPLFGVVWSSNAAIYALEMSPSLQLVDKSMECALNSLFHGYLDSYQSSEYAINISLTINHISKYLVLT